MKTQKKKKKKGEEKSFSLQNVKAPEGTCVRQHNKFQNHYPRRRMLQTHSYPTHKVEKRIQSQRQKPKEAFYKN